MRHAYIGAVIVSMATVLIGESLPAHANSLKKFVNIQPIEICDNLGERCAGTPLFAEETKAIWEKAGIDINFLPTTQLNSSLFLLSTEIAIDHGLLSGNPRTGVHADPNTINVWFAQDLPHNGGTRFGRGELNGNKLVLNSSAITNFNDGQGRIDTLAHELGHNFGLLHHHDSSHLLAAGNNRKSPESLQEIINNQTSLFSEAEIATVFASPLVQDIPQVANQPAIPVESTPEAVTVTTQLASELPVPKPLDHGHSHGLEADHSHDHGVEQIIEAAIKAEVNLIPEINPVSVSTELEPEVIIPPVSETVLDVEPEVIIPPAPETVLEVEPQVIALPAETVVDVEPEVIPISATTVLDVEPEVIIPPAPETVLDVDSVISAIDAVDLPVDTSFVSIMENNLPSPVSVPEPSSLLGIALGGLSLIRIRSRNQV